MARALVTGATGLVGSHLVERLLADGYAVRALVRGDRSVPGAELVRGDVLAAETFDRAAHGCDIIFHTAAAITPSGGWESYRHLNIDGTRNAIAAAERSGARLLQLSSVAVYGAAARYRAAGERTDETTPLAPLREHSYYARSKRESEALVLEAHAAGRIWATAVRPDVIYGRRDRQFVPRIARLLRFGMAPIVGSGRATLAIVHAANVADGALRAATSPVAGGRTYNLANDFDVSLADFLHLAGEGLGRDVRLVRIPEPLARGALTVLTRVLRVVTRGRLGVLRGAALDFVTRDNPFSSERARRELGWAPSVHPEEGVPDAFRWWRARARGSSA